MQRPSVPGSVLGVRVIFVLISAQVPWQGEGATLGEILPLDPFRHNTRLLHNTRFCRQREPDLLMLPPPKELLPPCAGS